MGKSSFGIGECIGAFVLSIYLLFLIVKGVVWLISAIYKKLSESSAETEPTFHWKTSKSSYKAESTKDYDFWKKYQSYTQDFNSNHSKKKRTYHKKTHSYKTQGNTQYNRSKKKEYYQKSDLRAKVAKAFQVLNLKGNESEREIKKAYRKAVKKWHPDNNHNWYAEKRFIEIHDAYRLLLNLKKARAI